MAEGAGPARPPTPIPGPGRRREHAELDVSPAGEAFQDRAQRAVSPPVNVQGPSGRGQASSNLGRVSHAHLQQPRSMGLMASHKAHFRPKTAN